MRLPGLSLARTLIPYATPIAANPKLNGGAEVHDGSFR